MKGVSNTIKEFSSNFGELYNSWKYVVEQNEDGISIKYIESDPCPIVHDEHGTFIKYSDVKDGIKWEEKDSITINFDVAERLFSEVLDCIRKGDFTEV